MTDTAVAVPAKELASEVVKHQKAAAKSGASSRSTESKTLASQQAPERKTTGDRSDRETKRSDGPRQQHADEPGTGRHHRGDGDHRWRQDGEHRSHRHHRS